MDFPQRKGFITTRSVSFEVAIFERAEGPTYRQPVAKATGTLRKKVFEA